MKLLNIKQNTLPPNKKKKTLLTRLNYLITFGYVRRNPQLAMNNIHAGKMNFTLENAVQFDSRLLLSSCTD